MSFRRPGSTNKKWGSTNLGLAKIFNAPRPALSALERDGGRAFVDHDFTVDPTHVELNPSCVERLFYFGYVNQSFE